MSASVARLIERGLLEKSTDSADRRRTRVSLAPHARRAILDRAGRSADEAIAGAVADPADAERAGALLDELARLLL